MLHQNRIGSKCINAYNEGVFVFMSSPDLQAEVVSILSAKEARARTPDKKGRTLHTLDLSQLIRGLAAEVVGYLQNRHAGRPELDRCLHNLMWQYFVRETILPPDNEAHRRSHDLLILTMNIVIASFVSAVIEVIPKSSPSS